MQRLAAQGFTGRLSYSSLNRPAIPPEHQYTSPPQGDDVMKRMPVIFAGHGSPMIALEKNELTRTFNRLGNEVIETFGRPKAILSLSAHWCCHSLPSVYHPPH